jgi:hypothetical protein
MIGPDLCAHCAKAPAALGRKWCLPCLAAQRQYQRKHLAALKAEGRHRRPLRTRDLRFTPDMEEKRGKRGPKS